MNTPLRWGILGVAKINERLIPAFHQSTTAELIGIASRSEERARHAAEASNIPKAYGSYEALLDDPDIDAIYNPLPNTLHDEWTRRAADRGKHVLCEKPLTPTVKPAIELVAYCRAKGIRLMDGFMWPHHPRTARIRELLDNGTIGEVQRANGAFSFKLDLKAENIRLKPDQGGGSLLDVGCYPIYGIRWAMGAEPIRVFAQAHYSQGVDVEMSGVLWFADGRQAVFDSGFRGPFRGWLEIAGSEGSIWVRDMWLPDEPALFEIRREGAAPEVHSVPGHDQIVCMLDDFAAAVRDEREPTPSPDEAIKTLRVLDALAFSAREGRVVEVTPG